ncbi:MAG: nuclear transport factor 2 family protein [Actinomycetota bacterium]|nr:nuclear transport factor 2 family protein [Actinomycetota bacterium]
MSQENVNTVRRLYDAWEHGDFAAEMQSYDPDVELILDFGPDRTSARGTDAMRDVWREQLSLWQTWSTGPIEKVVEEGDHVVVSHCLRARSKRGLPVQMDNAGASFTFKEGRIVRIVATDQMSKALEAVGLRE